MRCAIKETNSGLNDHVGILATPAGRAVVGGQGLYSVPVPCRGGGRGLQRGPARVESGGWAAGGAAVGGAWGQGWIARLRGGAGRA